MSVRGNAESVMSFLVLMCVKFLIDGQTFTAGLLYALSIHFKIYPVTYALAIYLFLGEGDGHHRNKVARGEGHQHGNRLRQTVMFLLPNRDRLVFAMSSTITLIVLTGLLYLQ